MARDSRLRIGGWLGGARPRGESPHRYGGDHGPHPSPLPDARVADDALTVAGAHPSAGDDTRPPAGGVPPDGAVAWPDGADRMPDGADRQPGGADWLPEDADWPPEGTDWSSEGGGWSSEDADWPTDGGGWPEAVPAGSDRPGGTARTYRGRRRRRRPSVVASRIAAVAAVVGLVLVGTGVIVQWAGTTGEGSLGPPPQPEPAPTVPASPDGGPPGTPDGGVSAGPDHRDGDAGRGEDRTPDDPRETPTGSADDEAGSSGDGTGSSGDGVGPGSGAVEAEDGSLARGASVETLGAASGGQVVKLSPNASVELSGLTVDRSGTYRLTVHYATTASHSAQVSINGGPFVDVEFPALDQGVVGTVVLLVALADGENTVTVARPDRPGLMVDLIAVTD